MDCKIRPEMSIWFELTNLNCNINEFSKILSFIVDETKYDVSAFLTFDNLSLHNPLKILNQQLYSTLIFTVLLNAMVIPVNP